MRVFNLFAFGIAALALLGACGGGDDDDVGGAPAGTSPSTTEATKAAPAPAGPDALAKTIYDDFVAMNKELATMLAGEPTAAQLKPKVAELKARYIEKFVASGRLRAKMNATDAAAVESGVGRLIFTPPGIDTTALSAAVSRFNRTDPALAMEISSLNILTQYAFFELLKKQEPAEAARLGIQ